MARSRQLVQDARTDLLRTRLLHVACCFPLTLMTAWAPFAFLVLLVMRLDDTTTSPLTWWAVMAPLTFTLSALGVCGVGAVLLLKFAGRCRLTPLWDLDATMYRVRNICCESCRACCIIIGGLTMTIGQQYL
jgi:hypothetical protein